MYGPGTSESVVGEWIASQESVVKSDLVIATKVFNPVGPGKNDRGLGRKHILQGVEQSLKRLQVETIDLYQAHKFDESTPLEETLVAFDDLVRSGKVSHIGLSNFRADQIERAILTAEILGLHLPIVSIQPQYNLLCREIEDDMLKVAGRHGLGVLPWSPLKGGWLTGKYTRESSAPTSGGRVEWAENVGWNETAWEVLANEHTWGVIDALQTVAAEVDHSVSSVALRWIMDKNQSCIPIVGARKLAHLVDNLSAAEFTLSPNQMATLDGVSEKFPVYPHSLYRAVSSSIAARLAKAVAAPSSTSTTEEHAEE